MPAASPARILSATSTTARWHGIRQFSKQLRGFIPSHARIGDALAMSQRLTGNQLLCTWDQIALQHDADDAPLAGGELFRDIPAHCTLASVVFVAVGVAAVDHHISPESGPLQGSARLCHRLDGVVHAVSPTA